VELDSLDEEGLLAGAVQLPSPNCDERPGDAAVRLLVVHNISLPPGRFGGEAIVQLFTNTLDFGAHPYYEAIRDLKVSAHFLVRRRGELIQLVPCTKRAWHAGPSSWWGRERCNDFSVGVELEGADDQAYSDRQYFSWFCAGDIRSSMSSDTSTLHPAARPTPGRRSTGDISGSRWPGFNRPARGRFSCVGPFGFRRFSPPTLSVRSDNAPKALEQTSLAS